MWQKQNHQKQVQLLKLHKGLQEVIYICLTQSNITIIFDAQHISKIDFAFSSILVSTNSWERVCLYSLTNKPVTCWTNHKKENSIKTQIVRFECFIGTYNSPLKKNKKDNGRRIKVLSFI